MQFYGEASPGSNSGFALPSIGITLLMVNTRRIFWGAESSPIRRKRKMGWSCMNLSMSGMGVFIPKWLGKL